MSQQITDVSALEGMSAEQVAKATREGRLDALLSGDPFGVEAARAEVMKARAEAAALVATPEPAALVATPEPRPAPVDQGARGTKPEPKYDAAWLATASAKQIAKATRQGKLSGLL
jgi:hypothetical protein